MNMNNIGNVLFENANEATPNQMKQFHQNNPNYIRGQGAKYGAISGGLIGAGVGATSLTKNDIDELRRDNPEFNDYSDTFFRFSGGAAKSAVGAALGGIAGGVSGHLVDRSMRRKMLNPPENY